ncbi:15-hydroxyprostaglandin dehydrogenase [NAD(+)]-like [Periophthalmus magnuspinnatus]|uniref:15-hydroxyprostaglandin dehydrogenase [NAD(+)]-like n=1 Tax=Periophthalmus magnuspinnatus TaxID=409849 RepID=UPI00145A15FB|nr:15-hydroxyprostaglandin dehydrogenase [NAD(+)]-like [Periophthalmus magnuspinnatus]
MALSGKVALVTGGAMGIGRAMVEELLKHGAKVALLDMNAGAGKSLLETLETKFGKDKTLFIECNVQSEEQLKAAFQKTVETFGGLDIVCNNAGVLNENEWENMVSINLMAMIRVAYLAQEHMSKLRKGHGGVIINTASMAGLGPLPGCPVYTATKYGVIGFTRSMALTSLGADDGVRFNAVCPGFVDTSLFNHIPERLGQFVHMKETIMRLADNIGTMEVSRVAEGMMELVSDEKKTGEALIIMPKGNKYATFPTTVDL